MQHPELALVIPVYNENEIIAEVIGSWHKILESLNIGFLIYVYNDGSKDNTLEILNTIKSEYPFLIIHNKINSGHGPTILKGYRENSDAGWIFQIDSDNEMTPDAFPKMWHLRDNYDFLIGRRNNRNAPLARKIISFISRAVVWIFYGKGAWDVNSPYRLMRTSAFSKVFTTIPDTTFAPNLIVTGMASKLKTRIFEVEVEHQNRKTGTVSIKKWKLFKVAFKSMIQTILFRFNYEEK